jgi:diphthine-ammonia ligase
MKAFVSWSGGKDCMLALHRFLQDPANEVVSLVNMCDDQSNRSRSHGLSTDLLIRQAAAMKLRLTQKRSNSTQYEHNFKSVLSELKLEGVTAGVFGDLYLTEHRVWIERVCKEMGIEAIFPLWENDTKALLAEFIELGFEAVTVSVRECLLPESWLGRRINASFFQDITALEGVDPCAENGEYHSFVFNGPLFKSSVAFEEKQRYRSNAHIFLEMEAL